MKIVDITAFNIVKPGIEFEIQSSTAKDDDSVAKLLPDMERNEGAVFWLEPKGGTVEQQEACICVNGVYYALNSKFEKAIFRNVRLTRDFKNYERLVDGKTKLVIPRRLFSEKLRTSRRNLSLMKRLEIKKQHLEPLAHDKAAEDQQPACAPPPLADGESPPEARETTNRAPETVCPAQGPAFKFKRKKRKLDSEHVFDVAGKLLDPHNNSSNKVTMDNYPPLLHTPHSLFNMLHETFEKEFPDVLPVEAIKMIKETLKRSA